MVNEIKCKYCNKIYSSMSSRSNHIKRIHKSNINNNIPEYIQQYIPENIQNCIYNCSQCNKKYKSYFSKWRHEKSCNKKDEKIEKLDQIIKENQELKMMIQNVLKIHPKTLQKINKDLSTTNNIQSNNGTINNGTVNNTIHNYIIPLSEQNLVEVLTDDEKIKILRAGSGTTPHLELLNTIYKDPKYKKYRNVYVTNLTNNYAHVFDDKENKYIIDTKEKIMDTYGDHKVIDIKDIYNDEIKEKVPKRIVNKVETFCEKYFDDEIFKKKIKEEMILNLYNNQDNVKKIYNETNKTLEL